MDVDALDELEDDPRATAADVEILRAAATGDGLVEISPEQFEELGVRAVATKQRFDGEFEGLTLEQARFVRQLRVDDGYTWRAVAATCALEWGGGWGSNQLAGMAICERAAALFGECALEKPWN